MINTAQFPGIIISLVIPRATGNLPGGKADTGNRSAIAAIRRELMLLESGFNIEAIEVRPLEGRVSGPVGDLRIEPKAMAVLVELARHAPGPCTRDHLIESVWPRGYVSDDVLTRCIGQIRRALGDDPRRPALLETIPRKGYRLRATVAASAATKPQARAVPRARESLIVLPFQNLSAAGEDFIADGLTELLTLRLAGIPDIRVISRTTAMFFKSSRISIDDIARQSSADWVIEGSVLQAGNQMQVIVQLIDARTDGHIWAADYVRDLGELLPLQNEIAQRIAGAIRLQLGLPGEAMPRAPTLAPDAVRNYLRARHLMSKRAAAALREALTEFLQVAAAEPEYAAAWASAAECELMLAHYGAPGRDALLRDCEAHTTRALALDPDLAVGLSTRGTFRFFFDCDFDGAAADLDRALVLLPSYSLAMVSRASVHLVTGNLAEAEAWMTQALLVDPLDVGVNMNHADHCILRRDFAGAIAALRRALQVSPGHRPCQLRLSWALALAGENEAAARLLAEIAPQGAGDPQWLEYAALVACARADHDAAARHHAALCALAATQGVGAWSLARAAAAAGERDAALAHLESAATNRSSSLPFMMLTPAFDLLRGERRFRRLGQRLKLAPQH